jgi:phage FluMu protein Com
MLYYEIKYKERWWQLMPIIRCPECGKIMVYSQDKKRVQCPVCKTWDYVSRLINLIKKPSS